MPRDMETPIYPTSAHQGELWERIKDGKRLVIMYTIQPEARVRYIESKRSPYIHLSRFVGPNAKYRLLKQPDYEMGDFVYCRPHVSPHSTGWCSVDIRDKIPLAAKTSDEAVAEVKKFGWPIFGYCSICYAWTANESWTNCPEHDE